MATVSRRGILMYSNPATRPGLQALDGWLSDRYYSQHAREQIRAWLKLEGTPTGSPYLEAEDEAGASEAYVTALPAVSFSDAAWGSDDDLEDLDVPPALAPLPPVCGGGPVGPDRLAGDVADFEAWLSSLDDSYPPDDQPEPGPKSWDWQTQQWLDARERGEGWAL